MTSEFTQKELIQHLLKVAQNTATRDEVMAVRQELSKEISNIRREIENEQRKQLDAKSKTKFNLYIAIIVIGFLTLITISLIEPA